MNDLDLPSLPEMVFGDTALIIEDKTSGFKAIFRAYEALQQWRQSPTFNTTLQVAYAQQWTVSREHPEELAVSKSHDWTFTTPYIGSMRVAGGSAPTEETEEKIDIELLKRPDPILFFSDQLLFEDELGDNGDAILSVKIRVMPTCWFVLLRFWLRVDSVLFRIKDTRVFHKFGTDSVIIEARHQEETYANMVKSGKLPQDPRKLIDSNLFSQLLPIKASLTRCITLRKKEK